MTDSSSVTQLLGEVRAGDRSAFDRLFSLVYDELRTKARWQLSQSASSPTLSTTMLVHEAYLKLSAADSPAWEDRRHFFLVAARAMRQIIVDQARRRLADKRGGNAVRIDLEDVDIPVEDEADQLLALEAAMERLEARSERLAEVVNLRFYAGLSVEDTARALQVSERTIKREWRLARAFLHSDLGIGPPPEGDAAE